MLGHSTLMRLHKSYLRENIELKQCLYWRRVTLFEIHFKLNVMLISESLLISSRS